MRLQGTFAIETQGCKLNQSDSESISRQFIQAGYRLVPLSAGPDIYVLNSCTVTHVADAKARQALRAAKSKYPDITVVATGCYAERAPDELSAIQGVDVILGNTGKLSLVETVVKHRIKRSVVQPVKQKSASYTDGLMRVRAMIKIQEGCNQICAYCIVPKVRGREKSIPPEELLKQVQQRVAEGYREVVLTGTQLGSYGFDLARGDLGYLIRLILENSELERLRVSSLQPQEISTKLLRLWEDPRLCPHFHMPLQSGSDTVLSHMRRRYTSKLYADTVDKIHRAVRGAAVTADVLVGFPGEGEEHFQESFRFCDGVNFSGMHVFPYSVRPGTSAAYMASQVDPKTKKERMQRMLALAEDKLAMFERRSLGEVREVLWERGLGRGVFVGLTDNYLKVRTKTSNHLTNQITWAKLTHKQDGVLYSRVTDYTT